MTETDRKTWQAVEAEVRRRIHARIWGPGASIPNEEALAQEFGCARATVNRALRNLSEAGLLERRRKAGTRVALHPVRKATLSIPVIRKEIEGLGQTHGYTRLSLARQAPPVRLRARLGAPARDAFLRVKSVQTADGVPFVFEDRWIDLTTVPEAGTEDFTAISANEWLVLNRPFTHGEIGFSATEASAEAAGHLGCAPGAAIFVIDRATFDGARPITSVRQFFAPGYRMQTGL